MAKRKPAGGAKGGRGTTKPADRKAAKVVSHGSRGRARGMDVSLNSMSDGRAHDDTLKPSTPPKKPRPDEPDSTDDK